MIEPLAQDAADELQQFLHSQPEGVIELETIERVIEAKAMNFGRAVLSTWLNERQHAASASSLQCSCGGLARRAGQRDKDILTSLERLTLTRAYYHCATCQGGWCPVDRQLGIDGERISSAVQRMIGRVAGELSFASIIRQSK